MLADAPPNVPARAPAAIPPVSARPSPYAQPRPAVVARPRRRVLAIALAATGGALVAGLGLAVFVAAQGGWYVALATVPAPEETTAATPLPPGVQRGLYLVVDTWDNRVRVYRNGVLEREAVCSTGSGTILRDPRDGREWVFDTPQGERRVQRKKRDPVWTKPDWAFVEEGKLPPKSFRDRIDDLSLGDYALDLGDGYLMHGTLFQTLLGQRLTHGCIRLGDADLEWVYNNVPVGTRVYLY